MASQFYNVTTNNGDAKIANAIATATKLNITHVVFGDGNGSVPTPDKSRTALVNQVYSVAPSNYYLHPTIANRLIVEAIIPSDVGGFYIREVGLIADTTVLISDGSVAPIFKEASTDGTREYKLKFAINIVDSSIANITLDSSLIYVTQDTIVDNLTTNDSTKPLSAAQGKVLQDNKLAASEVGLAGGAASLGVDGFVPDTELKKASTTQVGIVQLINDLVTGGVDKALTAEQGKLLLGMFTGGPTHFKVPNPSEPLKPWIVQMGTVTVPGAPAGQSVTFPVAFPNGCFYSNAGDEHGATGNLDVAGTYNTTKTGMVVVLATQSLSGGAWTYPTGSVKWIAVGN